LKHVPQSVRIIGGAWRGRRLTIADSKAVRPTPNRVRETLFNWLQCEIEGADCLDLFCGSGVLGIEAVSRGARQAVLVDSDKTVVSTIETQIQKLKTDAIQLICENAFHFLYREHRSFDIVFLDPPFHEASPDTFLLPVLTSGLIRPAGVIYLEYATRHGHIEVPSEWCWRRHQTISEVSFGLIERQT
jgi:16S rRNA (guanine966-N2)-methyltransferase